MLYETAYFFDLVGALGAILSLTAYGLLQIDKIKSENFFYSFSNLLASLMILFSLIYSWNLGAFLMEGSWFLISGFGIFKGFSRLRMKREN